MSQGQWFSPLQLPSARAGVCQGGLGTAGRRSKPPGNRSNRRQQRDRLSSGDTNTTTPTRVRHRHPSTPSHVHHTRTAGNPPCFSGRTAPWCRCGAASSQAPLRTGAGCEGQRGEPLRYRSDNTPASAASPTRSPGEVAAFHQLNLNTFSDLKNPKLLKDTPKNYHRHQAGSLSFLLL